MNQTSNGASEKAKEQLEEACRIRDLICEASRYIWRQTGQAPYSLADFQINEDYIEPAEEFPEPKIEIRACYTIAPTFIESRSLRGLIKSAAWQVERIVRDGGYDDPPSVDSEPIGAPASGAGNVARLVLIADASFAVENALGFIEEQDALLDAEKYLARSGLPS